MPDLQELLLDARRFKNEDLIALEPLKELRYLQLLDGYDLTRDGVAQLRASLPNCKIKDGPSAPLADDGKYPKKEFIR